MLTMNPSKFSELREFDKSQNRWYGVMLMLNTVKIQYFLFPSKCFSPILLNVRPGLELNNNLIVTTQPIARVTTAPRKEQMSK